MFSSFFEPSCSIFTLNIFGSHIHILTNPSDVATVHKNPTVFNIGKIVAHILMSLGMSKQGAYQLTEQTNPNKKKDKTTLQFVNELLTQQTSGMDLKVLARNAVCFLQGHLSPATVLSDPSLWLETRGTKCIPLNHFVRTTIITTLQGLFFSPALSSLSPDLPETLMAYSSQGYRAWYQYPWFLRLSLDRHIRRLQGAFKTYFAMPKEERQTCAWFTQRLEDTYRGVGATAEDLSVVMHFFCWGYTCQFSLPNPYQFTALNNCRTLMELQSKYESSQCYLLVHYAHYLLDLPHGRNPSRD